MSVLDATESIRTSECGVFFMLLLLLFFFGLFLEIVGPTLKLEKPFKNQKLP